MKFSVERTTRGTDKKPCEGAIFGEKTFIAVKNLKSPDDFEYEMDREYWFRTGTNHRCEDGKIKKDMLEKYWTIEIENIEALVEFAKLHGDIIIIADQDNMPGIEIYDGYRE